ncbi:MAG TPA: class I SAM-dependent methyltransferase [Usitatibacter sp.]|nr:class I SAM-dependent methyltransferase [Usitatibacter sp.]
MATDLDALTAELEAFGRAHDAATPARGERMLNITRDTGEFLRVLVHAASARRVLEIGTSNGYSTLWLAAALAAKGGKVETVERGAHKVALAAVNFARSGLAPFITQLHDDAQCVLRRSADGQYDLVFLDSERSEYVDWWPDLRRVLRAGGLLVVDNAGSHREELAPFVAVVNADAGFNTCLVPVGKGEFLAAKAATP